MPTATSDSEEGARIETSQEGGDNHSQASSEKKRLNGGSDAAIDGHNDVRLRRIYLILFATVLFFSILGLILLLIWMFYYRPITGIFDLTNADQLSNLHSIIMYTFMLSLNMFSLLIYRTFYFSLKGNLKWTHAILGGLNIVMSVLGVFAMLKSHWMNGYANFYSLHSWIGTTAISFYLLQFVAGFVAYLKPGLTDMRRKQLMPWHRMLGTYILVLASLAAITGITETILFQDKNGEYKKFSAITFLVNFSVFSIIIMSSITVYLLQAKEYQRRPLQEELPIQQAKR